MVRTWVNVTLELKKVWHLVANFLRWFQDIVFSKFTTRYNKPCFNKKDSEARKLCVSVLKLFSQVKLLKEFETEKKFFIREFGTIQKLELS